ncbi:hypothetical protein DL769_001965 [Monosporascus sp. CRB-8-3]|nr:hypothetical protein DL769_001965 [Monosporascus sp. CRB-8-3]
MDTPIAPPLESIDWDHLTIFGGAVAGHIESHYSIKTGRWSDPELVEDPHVRIHGLAPGLNYGQQCYEGLKAFRVDARTVSIFRPWKHAARMSHSAECVSIPPIPEDHFVRCVELAVTANSAYVPPHTSQALLYIRPVAFGSGEMIGLAPPSEFSFCVFVKPANAYHGTKPIDALVLEDFDRAAPRGTGNAKVGGNYAPVMRWSGAAMKEGYGITLHLDSATRSEIDEFSSAGFMGIKTTEDGKITVVIPDSAAVIDSVTSDSCVALAKEQGWTVEKRPIKYGELPMFSEVLAVGTAAGIVPIKSLTRKSTGDKFSYAAAAESAGPCCQVLSAELDAAMRGKGPDPRGWRTVIGQGASKGIDDTTMNAATINGTIINGTTTNGGHH